MKAFVIVLVAAALIAVGVHAMHGKGHQALMKWLPSIHGGSNH